MRSTIFSCESSDAKASRADASAAASSASSLEKLFMELEEPSWRSEPESSNQLEVSSSIESKTSPTQDATHPPTWESKIRAIMMPKMELRQDFFLGASSGEAGLPPSALTVAWGFFIPLPNASFGRPDVVCAMVWRKRSETPFGWGCSSKKGAAAGRLPVPAEEAVRVDELPACGDAPLSAQDAFEGELLRASEEPAVALAASFFSSSRRRASMRSFADTSRTLGEALSADFPGRPAGAAGAAGFAGEAGTAGAAGTP